MKTQIIRSVLLMMIASILLSSCKSVTSYFPKEPRPFQKKKFDSEKWKSGDAQTRGEMAENLHETVEDYKNPWKKSADEVRQILGKPDKILQTECCYTGRLLSPEKVEMWLYYIEIENDYRDGSKPREKVIPQGFKLYFPNNPANPFHTAIGDREQNHSMQMPVVGMIMFRSKNYDYRSN